MLLLATGCWSNGSKKQKEKKPEIHVSIYTQKNSLLYSPQTVLSSSGEANPEDIMLFSEEWLQKRELLFDQTRKHQASTQDTSK